MKNITSTILATTLVSLLAVSQSVMAEDSPRDEYSMASLVSIDTSGRVNYSINDDTEESSTDLDEQFPEYEH